jgi:tRNA-specific 2-thiouridylase
MRLWTQEDRAAPTRHRRCCSVEDSDDARAAAGALGIPHYVLSLEREFARDVVDYFVDEYRRGRTPNPCLACNQHVKFRSLLERSRALGADYLATGHYARIDRLNGHHRLLRALDRDKDQSYVLYTLGQRELSRLLLPVGHFSKEGVRELAVEMGLPVADKPGSVDICFIPDNNYRTFIAGRVPQTEGDVVDASGRVLGRHRGVAGFTVGQRRGLGVTLGEPRFVTAVDPVRNLITIGPEEDLLTNTLVAEDVQWVAGTPPSAELEAQVKIRYRTRASPALVRAVGTTACVRFERPQRAVTPGQAAVFYRGDEVLGGGIIASARGLDRRVLRR